MARPKKNGTYLNVCIETPIYERLENFCKDAGHTKTVAVERALISYFDEYEEIQNPNLSILSFTKPNEDYLMREIMRYVGNASSAETIRISPEVFQFTTDERKQFVKGFADVTGYIRKSNYAYHEPQYRVYFEIPHNWELVADFSNLLKSIDIPVQNIDWAHPNMRDGDLKKYNQGKPDFWKKEHQVKVWAVEYQPIGFAVLHVNGRMVLSILS